MEATIKCWTSVVIKRGIEVHGVFRCCHGKSQKLRHATKTSRANRYPSQPTHLDSSISTLVLGGIVHPHPHPHPRRRNGRRLPLEESSFSLSRSLPATSTFLYTTTRCPHPCPTAAVPCIRTSYLVHDDKSGPRSVSVYTLSHVRGALWRHPSPPLRLLSTR